MSQESKPGGPVCSLRTVLLCVFVFLIVMSHVKSVVGAEAKCSQGLDTPGVTYPPGDIHLLGGEPLDIWCILHSEYLKQGLNSSNLVFYEMSEQIEPEFVSIVNETTIRLHIDKPPLSDSMYYCKLRSGKDGSNGSAVCLNNVVIGTQPKKVENFSCLSLNWQNLTCEWKPPQNFLKTTYTLTYKLQTGRSYMYECPNMKVNQSSGFYSCFWDQSTSPHYRQAHENYTFELTGANKFGKLAQDEYFHHYAHVKPSAPVAFQKINKTISSVYLKWKVPSAMQNFPPGLIHKIVYQSQYDGYDTWQTADFTDLPLKHPILYYNLTNLRYAYAWYDIRIYLKSGRALGDDLWSDFASLTFRTMGKPPDRPPTTEIGSFEVFAYNHNRDVHLYWKQIEEHEKNGDNFHYKVVSVDVDGVRNATVEHYEMTAAYAKFKTVSFKSLNFTIVSTNDEGDSRSQSHIYIPEQYRMVPEPLAFTKISFGNGLYELSWRSPIESSIQIDSYTIFWCDNKRDLPYQCEGQLESTTVSSAVNILNVTVSKDKVYQFAISANSESLSSGMVWATCTAIPNKIVGKMKNVWINLVGPTYIELGWKLDCSERIGITDGYRVFYCPIDSPTNRGCKGPDENVTIPGDSNSIRGTIRNLKPYTTYRLKIAVITKLGDGLLSDPLFNTTLEAAPTPPLKVFVSDLSNTRMLVSWNPPEFMNGVLRYYKLNYNRDYVIIDNSDRFIDKTNEMELTNLSSYTNYSITVQACTVSCSLPSDEVTVRTAIGRPGLMDKPKVQSHNSSQVLLTWHEPFYSGGSVDLYEIRVIQSSDDGRNATMMYNTTASEFIVPAAVCQKEGILTYLYSVRAINYDNANDHGAAVFGNPDAAKLTMRPSNDNGTVRYVGPWSQHADNICYSSQANNTVLYCVIGVAMIIVAFAAFIMGSKWLWNQYKSMHDIGECLPPGLETIAEKDSTKYPLGNWGSQVDRKKDEKSFTPSADEVSLLPNRTVDRNGRDISGFSVNTDSTNLSLASSRIPVDTSKDQPILQDSAQSESHSANSSLRLRNASRPASTASSEQNSWNSPYMKRNSNQGESIAPYTTWGGDDYFTQPPPPKGYVSLDAFNGDPTPQQPSNGYVAAPTIPAPNYTKTTPLSPAHLVGDISIGYIKTSPDHVIGLSLPNRDDNKVPLGYVRVDELPPIAGDSIPSSSDYMKPSDLIPKGYVGLQDPILTKCIINPILEDDDSSSPPEGYSRFGWNGNSPIKGIGSLTLPDSKDDYNSLIEDFEYDDTANEESTACEQVRPANSSYLPLNINPIRH